jgi:DNA-directed RNA polymerase specialized sigma24 family protein
MGAVEREVVMTSDDGFDEFYQSAFGRLVGQVYLVTGDLSDAEDAVQEAFARAAARWGRCVSLPYLSSGSAGWR